MEENEVPKMEELIEQEQLDNYALESIKASDQSFIQLNYHKMSVEQLALATLLPPDIIVQYVNEYEAYLKREGISTDKKFNLIIGMSTEGTVTFSIEWPDIQSTERLYPYVGKLMYLLNNGKLKEPIVRFLGKYADERGAHRIVKEIIQTWNENEKSDYESAIIEANEVFKE